MERIDGETVLTVGLVTTLLPIGVAIWRLAHNFAKGFRRFKIVEARSLANQDRSVEADKRSRHNGERLNRLEWRGQPFNRRRDEDQQEQDPDA